MTQINGYNFNPKLTKRILKYKDFKLFPGGHKLPPPQRWIRWMLEDENGTSVYCDKCGNIANLCLLEVQGRYLLQIPICKRHAEELLDSTNEYVVRDLLIFKKDDVTAINAIRNKERSESGT